MATSEITTFRKAYKYKGKYCPRVTTVLNEINKPQLTAWKIRTAFERMAEELLKFGGQSVVMTELWVHDIIGKSKAQPDVIAMDAANIGTRAHLAIEMICLGKEPVIDDETRPCVDAFLAWQKESGITVKLGEVRVASEEYGYAGTMDAIGERTLPNGKKVKVILDWKTSKGIWPEMAFQVSSYCHAYNSMHPDEDPVEEAWIIRFPKEVGGTFEAKKIADLEESFKVFKAALTLYKSKKVEYFE